MRNGIICFVLLSVGLTVRPAAAATCDGLAALALPDTRIDVAQVVAAGAFSQPGGRTGRGGNAFADLPAFCRVAATLKPSSDSDIRIEVCLPLARSNRK